MFRLDTNATVNTEEVVGKRNRRDALRHPAATRCLF